jgi:NTE family protein
MIVRLSLYSLLTLVALAGCATRPINPPLANADRGSGYRIQTRPQTGLEDTFIIIAFSGGGTRAAAFAYGVLEELRRTEVTVNGRTSRLLDDVDMITGVSGGSFTALAYALYGDKLFDAYEQQFLKHNVQGDLIARFLNPTNWTALWSEGYGRSEMAEQLYDDILFHGATFGDLIDKPGPLVMVTATDISTGSRLAFSQSEFDIICSNLSAVPLSRAAAASSAVPVALSPVTLNNYGGTCNYKEPSWASGFMSSANTSRPAGRALQRLKELQSFEDGKNRPYLHLVDGGVSDNLGMRAVLEAFEELEASAAYRRSNRRIDKMRRVVVFVVNSLSSPAIDWDKHERPPNSVQILLKATGVPIDRYSYEAVELLKDIVARWQLIRSLRAAGAFANAGNSALAKAASGVPDIDIFPIDVSFEALDDEKEREYLMDLPTSFYLPPEAVDRLRGSAGKIVRESPDFQRFLQTLGKSLPMDHEPSPVEIR